MAEANPDTGTITDEAAMDLMFEEQGANLDAPDQAAQTAEVAEGDQPDAANDDQQDIPADPDQPAAPMFTVKIDGKDMQVSQDELISGYQRQADYTRKTQEIAREREVITSGTSELKAALQFWATPQQEEPNWTYLAQQMDPREFNQLRAKWDTAQGRSRQARALYDRIVQQEQSTLLQREQAALFERIPEWSNRDTARAELSSIVKAAGEFGFTEQEVGAVTDHRVILMARELARLKGADRALATQKQATPQARVTPQGRARTDDTAARNQKLLDNLKRTGSDDAAMALILGG